MISIYSDYYLGNFGDLFTLPEPELFSDRGESGAGVYKPLLVHEQHINFQAILMSIIKME